MRGPIRSVLLAAVAVCALGALTAGSASAATIGQPGNTAFLAIYGNPGVNNAAVPVGGGLGRNFGFGENMLFSACSGCTTPIGENLSITIGGATEEAKFSEFGITLMSNKTGENNPLSMAIQFADFQKGTLAGYSDTWDNRWIAEVCSPLAAAGKCKTDPNFNTPVGSVKIENVAIALGKPGEMTVVQGTVWGKWANGEAKKCPTITLELPPEGAAADQTLVETQASGGIGAVGTKITAIKGKVCLESANNDWYQINATEKEEPAITIKNE